MRASPNPSWSRDDVGYETFNNKNKEDTGIYSKPMNELPPGAENL
jgi:hypothetical protein